MSDLEKLEKIKANRLAVLEMTKHETAPDMDALFVALRSADDVPALIKVIERVVDWELKVVKEFKDEDGHIAQGFTLQAESTLSIIVDELGAAQ